MSLSKSEFEKLVDTYSIPLLRLLEQGYLRLDLQNKSGNRIIPIPKLSRTEAQDIVQESLIFMMTQEHFHYDNTVSAYCYLKRVAARKAKQYLRNRDRQTLESDLPQDDDSQSGNTDDTLSNLKFSQGHNTLQQTQTQENAARLIDTEYALQQLPTHQRTILQMYFLNKMTLKAIGEHFDHSHEWARDHLNQAKARMRKLLSDWQDDSK